MATKDGITLSDDLERVVDRALKRAAKGELCTFCGKTRRQVKALVANTCPPGIHPVYICNECVGQCVVVLRGMKP